MRMSEDISELAKALAAAQGEMEGASKNAKNPHLKNRYADIAAVWEAMRGALTKHGLAVSQVMCDDTADGTVCVESILMHASGQWIASRCTLPAPKRDPQGYGSAITYARRYSLSALVGVVSEEDDDGESAKLGSDTASRQKQGAQPGGNKATPQQRNQPPHQQHTTSPPPTSVQHVSLADACGAFMQCASVDALKATAARLNILSDNPQCDAIRQAYASRLQDIKAQNAQPQGGDRADQRTITQNQRTAIMAYYGKRGMNSDDKREARLADLSSFCARTIASVNDLTLDEASAFIEAINADKEAA